MHARIRSMWAALSGIVVPYCSHIQSRDMVLMPKLDLLPGDLRAQNGLYLKL